jgi:hypothetical protein
MKSLFLVSFVSVIAFFQEWIVQPIDTRVTVSFPSKPTKKTLGNEPYFTVASEEGFSCTVMVTDYSKGAPDSTSLKVYMESPAAKQSTEESLVRDFTGGKIINSKTSKYLGYASIDVDMTTGQKSSDGQFDVVSYRIIAVGMNVYSLYFYYDQTKPLPKVRDKFFNSFTAK